MNFEIDRRLNLKWEHKEHCVVVFSETKANPIWVTGAESPFWQFLANEVLDAHEIGEFRQLKLNITWSFAPVSMIHSWFE